MSLGTAPLPRKRKQPGQLCLVCLNEKKRRYGSPLHACDCEELRERAANDRRARSN